MSDGYSKLPDLPHVCRLKMKASNDMFYSMIHVTNQATFSSQYPCMLRAKQKTVNIDFEVSKDNKIFSFL